MTYRLRWRFEYSDGKPDKAGPWSRASVKPAEMAAFQSKEALKWAVIEGEDLRSWDVKRLAEVPGEDFRNFEWVAGASYGVESGEVRHELLGLKIRAREKTVQVLSSGSVTESPVTEEDKKIHLAGFGK